MNPPPEPELVKPTINEMIRQCLKNRIDRCALVRPEQGTNEVGVCVLAIGDKAIRELGPGLLDFAEQAGELKSGEILDLRFDESLKWMFKWIEGTKNSFGFGSFKVDVPLPCQKVSCLVVVFLGKKICKPLSRFLTNRNCPCNLT